MSFKYIRVASDLHLEGFSNTTAQLIDHFLPADERDLESILVLAGDISSRGEQLIDFLTACSERFQKVYYVAGNHEYYKHDYYDHAEEMSLKLKISRLQNLETSFIEVGYEELKDQNLRFIFAPLWGDGGPTLADQGTTGHYLNDFRLITSMGHRFTVNDMISEHLRQKKEIARLLNTPFNGKTVVITHHLPSRRLVSLRFWPGDGSDGANGGFVGNCEDLLACEHAPWLWIHGHTHDTIDTTLWNTRIICNPAGYRGEWGTSVNTFIKVKNGKGVVQPKFIELT